MAVVVVGCAELVAFTVLFNVLHFDVAVWLAAINL